MSGELRTSQFRWTTTANDDFVIGSPEDAGTHATKFIVFQTNTTPGYATNPHFRCEWSGSAWEFKMSPDGSSTVNLSDIAYKSAVNVFSAANTFNTGAFTVSSTALFSGSLSGTGTFSVSNSTTAVIASPAITLGTTGSDTATINSNTTFANSVLVSGSLTVSGATSSLNTTNLTVKDTLITLNKAGIAASGEGSGLEVEEGGSITGYAKLGNSRSSWTFSTPTKSGSIWLTPSAGAFSTELISSATAARVLTLPNATGTLALTSDIPTGTFTISRAIVRNGTTGALQVSATTSTEIGYISGLTSAVQTQLDSRVTLTTAQDITGSKTFQAPVVVNMYSGGPTYTGYISLVSGSTVAFSGGFTNYKIDTTTSAVYSQSYACNSVSISKAALYLGLSGAESTTSGLTVTRTVSPDKVALEIISEAATGSSSIILRDKTTHVRYELYMDSGVLTIALA